MREKDIPIYVVDDDGSVRIALKRLLNAWGFNVKTFQSAGEFFCSGLFQSFGVFILDVRMPGMSGLELQKRLTGQNSEVPVIFVSAYDDIQVRTTAMEAGAVAFLQKPVEERDLVDAVDQALGRHPNEMPGRPSPGNTGGIFSEP